MFQIALFLFFFSFFFFLWPTIKRQLLRMQEGGYHYEKFVAFMKAQRKTESMWVLFSFILSSFLLRDFFALPMYLLLHAAVLLILGLLHLRARKEPGPVPDGRLWRLAAGAGLLFVVLLTGIGVLFRRTFFWELPFVAMFLGFMTDTWIFLGNFLVKPLERRREKNAIRRARGRIDEFNAARASAGKAPLRIVGVAGSFGKSSLIAVAQQVLGVRYTVLATEPQRDGSLGSAADCILGQLTAEHDVLLVEIGARHPGDVRAFCKELVPDYGVITSAAERNLETFLAADRIAGTQMELLEGVRRTEDGAASALINYDDDLLRKQKTGDAPVERYGTYSGGGTPQHLDVWADGIETGIDGGSFALRKRGGDAVSCRVNLPGRFFVQNCVGAAALAYRLSMSAAEIAAALSGIVAAVGSLVLLPEGEWPAMVRKKLAKPWEADAAETREAAPFRILDDGRQASLDGAKDSLQMLEGCAGYRILLTAGLRGQGEQEDEYNRRLGRQAARSSDAIVVIGRGKMTAFEDGARRAGFNFDNLFAAPDAREGVRRALAIAAESNAKDGAYLLVLGEL